MNSVSGSPVPDSFGKAARPASSRAAAAGVFDVAISFSSRDAQAAALAAELQAKLARRGLRVFYFRDRDHAAAVLGERLSAVLPAVFRDRARVALLIGSATYGRTPWTEVELAAALERPVDEDGKPRVVPVSADGSAVPGVPDDVIRGSQAPAGRADVDEVVDLMARRLGRRRSLEPLAATGGALVALAALAGGVALAGLSTQLRAGLLWLAWALLSWAICTVVVPRAWMARRRRAAGEALRVVTEGPSLSRFRSLARAAGWGLAALVLAATVGAALDAVAARLAMRDVRVLLEAGDLGSGLARMAANRERLADFREDLLALARNQAMSEVEAGRWRTVAAVYPALVESAGARDPRFEAALWARSGIDSLGPGAAVTDHLEVAEVLRGSAPDLARRLFETAVARELEQAMDGNAFYYGFDGARAWSTYRRLEDPVGRDAWLAAHATSRLPNNPGLAPRIDVFLAARGDRGATERLLGWLGSGSTPPAEPESAALEELAVTSVPETLRPTLERALVAAWHRLQATEGPRPVGFALAEALGSLATPETSRLLFVAAAGEDEQARAHAVTGLARLARGTSPQRARALAAVSRAGDDQVELVAWAARRALPTQPRCVDELGSSMRGILEEWLAAGSPPAGVADVSMTLRLYRDFCREAADALLVASVARALGEPVAVPRSTPAELEALRQGYESLGTPPGAASDAGAHVEALRAFAASGDPRAADYLESIFDSLAHGSMRIAAAEALLVLRGSFGDTVLAELDSLTQMPSSIYRAPVVDLLEGQLDRVRLLPEGERRDVLAILRQIANTGETAERGRALDLLSALDERVAWSEAKRLASSSQVGDRLEGYERLVALWSPG